MLVLSRRLGWANRAGLSGAALVTLCLGTGGCAGSPDPDAFVAADSTRIMEELRYLSSDSLEGRRTGEPGNVLAREFIVTAFQEAGLQEPERSWVQPFEFRSRRDTTQVIQGANVLGYVPGTDPDVGAMFVTAHFDHLGVRDGEIYNGADDNASGTVVLLSIARYVAQHPLRHTAVFAALDAEEMGLQGARALVAAGWSDEVALNVNMDMVAHSDSLLFAAGTYHYPQLRPLLESVGRKGPVVLRFGHDRPREEGQEAEEGEDDWTNSSDHAAFHRAGIPFVYFGVEDHEDYHRPTDDFERINQAFFINAIRTVLAAVLACDEGLQPDSVPSGTQAADTVRQRARPEDVATIDGIIKAYYDVVSGPAGESADQERDRTLHHPEAWVAIANVDSSGTPAVDVMTLDGYYGDNAPRVQGFWEWETDRSVQRSGNMVHVWSSYATSREPGGEPFALGVNSITLFHDGERWWIMNWMFDASVG
jgi:hypothetical protein